jgi:outer membrane protein insertion porin family
MHFMRSGFLIAVLLLFSAAVHAVQPFKVKDIRVVGAQRTDAGTVFSYLPVKVGDTLNDEKAAAAIKALYATGFYSDVRLEVENDVLVVLVQERPAIAQIDIDGSKEFTKENLKDGLKQVGLTEAKIFDRSTLDRAEKEIKRQYTSRGFYSAKVTTTVTPLERNRISLSFKIDEGEVAKIVDINIIGATVFKEKELLDQFELSTGGWLSWFTKDDQYSKQKLTGDLEKLRSFYLNRGYLEFNVDSTQVSITPDKEKIYITVNVTEGPVYSVSDIKFNGDLKIPEAEMTSLLLFKSGEVFSRQKVVDSVKRITDRLGNDGYSFANVNPVPDLDKEKRTAAFTLFVDAGRRVYIRRINIVGNQRTRDEVIRRELRQLESSWYSVEKINRSKERIDRTGFFEDVNIETPAVPGSQDQVDLNVTLKEKNTGQLQFGVGYSQLERFTISTSVSQANIFGSGNQLSLAVNSGSVNKTYALSYLNPYWSVDGVSRGFDIYRRDLDTSTLAIGSYTSKTEGLGVRFGVPITEYNNVNFGLGYERTKLGLNAISPQRYIDFVNLFGYSTDTLRGSLGFASDTRDSIFYPTRGSLYEFGVEGGLPGADLKYYRATYHQQWLRPVYGNIVLALNGEVGVAGGYGGKPLPFFKNFYAGGVDSIRGFQTSTLGPKDTNGDALGGTKRIVGNVELLFPMPGVKSDKSVRLSGFLDVGNVFAKDEKINASEMRASVGIAVSWYSPVGPLKFSLAKPLKKMQDDKIERFQFLLGRVF